MERERKKSPMERAREIVDEGQKEGAALRKKIAEFRPAGALSGSRYHESTERPKSAGKRRRRSSRRKSRKSRRKRRKSRKKRKKSRRRRRR